MADLAALQKDTGITFNDTALLELALTHTSFVNENAGTITDSNERLEFLGDAVLGFIVAERLYRDSPGLSEGEMTRLRSVVVRRDALYRAAKAINLGEYLYLGKGEEASGGRSKPANLARAMEALIAAVFLDKGVDDARRFLQRWLDDELGKAVREGLDADHKSKLQEFLQSRQQPPPDYRLAEATGPDHKRWFTIEVAVGGKILGKGSGSNKKQAEAEAARLALERLSSDFTQ